MAASTVRQHHAPTERERKTRRVAEATFAFSLLPCLFAVLLVSLLEPFWEHERALLTALVVGGLGWALAIGLARGGGMSLRVVVGGAIALRLVAFAGTPDLSDDLYRYVWEGEVLARGESPYALAPDAPELEHVRAARPELAARVGHPDVPAAYPPLVQAVGGLFARLGGRSTSAGSASRSACGPSSRSATCSCCGRSCCSCAAAACRTRWRSRGAGARSRRSSSRARGTSTASGSCCCSGASRPCRRWSDARAGCCRARASSAASPSSPARCW